MIVVILGLIAVIAILYFCVFHKSVEWYRDPLYMNQQKLSCDWYPRTTGSIYGMPIKYGGGWHLMSGYSFAPKAY